MNIIKSLFKTRSRTEQLQNIASERERLKQTLINVGKEGDLKYIKQMFGMVDENLSVYILIGAIENNRTDVLRWLLNQHNIKTLEPLLPLEYHRYVACKRCEYTLQKRFSIIGSI